MDNKILIIGFFPRTNMPYVSEYENILNEENISYDLVCFDRTVTKETETIGNVTTFYSKQGTNKLKKIIPYLRFAKMIKRMLKKNSYQKLIVLTTVPAFLLKKILIQKYSGKYIFDYRDYSFEKYVFYKNAVNKIADNSYATFLSSGGFYTFVNKSSKTNLVHNISNSAFETKELKPVNFPIRIGFVGLVRYFDINTKLIEAFKNNPEYSLVYHGSIYDDCNLPMYCKRHSINNVMFTGPYENSEKPDLYADIDIINSIYSLSSPEVSQAIPNRLYDGALFKKPLLVAKNCYLAEVVEKYGLGKSIDTTMDADGYFTEINSFIKNFDQKKFIENCNIFLKDVSFDQTKFRSIVRKFVR